MGRRKELYTCYLRPDQLEALRRLSEVTRVPVNEYIRQAVDLFLARSLQVPAKAAKAAS